MRPPTKHKQTQKEKAPLGEDDIVALEAGAYSAVQGADSKNQKKKSRIRMLGKQSKKYQRIMKRFDDEDDGEDGNDRYEQEDDEQQEESERPRKQKRAQKAQDSEEVEVEEEEEDDKQQRARANKKDKSKGKKASRQQDQQQQQQQQQAEEGKKVFIGDVFSQILSQDTKQASNPVFSQFKKPLKKVKQMQNKEKKQLLTKRIKKLKENRGLIPPLAEGNKLKDRELKITAVKGVIKILEAIKNFKRGKDNDEEDE